MALGDWLGAISMGMSALGGSIGNAVGSVKIDPNVVTPDIAQPELSEAVVPIDGADGGFGTDIVQGVGLDGKAGLFDLDSKNLKPGSVTGAYGDNYGTFNADGATSMMPASKDVFTPTQNLNQTGADMKTKTPGTESSGLGKGLFSGENIMKAAQLFLSYKKDKSDKKIKKAQINHNIKKDQNARDRTKSVKASMGYGSSLSGSDFKYV